MGFTEAVNRVIELEGGFVDHSQDKGGPTKYGITENLAKKYGYHGEMKELSQEEAKMIYKAEFWDRYHLNLIKDGELAGRIFSFGVNAGMYKAIKALQEGYNLLTASEIAEDGILGPETLQAVNHFLKIDRLIKVVKSLQGEHYLNLVRKDTSQHLFLAGWLNRIF